MSSSAAAAAAAAVVPFNCIVCFEEFTLHDRFPVILPCGHTYVCSVCSKRLDKCMECRTPLFWTPPTTCAAKPSPALHRYGGHNNRTGGALSYRTSGRYRTVSPPPSEGASPVKAAEKAEPVPLPLPKNLVLMTLMEANERQASLLKAHHSDEEGGIGQDDNAEIDRIIVGMEALSGPCGTYAVKEVEGLAVLPLDPRKHHATANAAAEPREPFTIEMGQTVQVVDARDGVVTLARDMGYIVATSAQLVKVGGPMDKTCELTGMLDLVQLRKKELQKQMDELTRMELGLHQRIQNEQAHEPTYPIITPLPEDLPSTSLMDQTAETISPQDSPTNSPVSHSQGNYHPKTQSVVTPQTPPALAGVEVNNGGFCPDLMTPVYESSSGSSPTKGLVPKNQMYTPSPSNNPDQHAGSPNTIDNSDIGVGLNLFADEGFSAIPLHRDDSNPDLVQVGCTALFGPRYCDDGTVGGLSLDGITHGYINHNTTSSDDHTIAETVGDNSVATARTQQTQRSAPLLNSSFDSVDFRTGLSGHRALSNKTACQQAVRTYRGEIRMMSEHKGIGKVRGPVRRSTQN